MFIEVLPTGAAIGAEIRGVNLPNTSTTPPLPQLRTPTTLTALSSFAIRVSLRRNRLRSPAALARSNSIYSVNAGACPATRRSLSSLTSPRKIVRWGSAVPETIGTATCDTRRGRHAARCFTPSRSPSYMASPWATQSLPVRRRRGRHYLTRSGPGLKGGVPWQCRLWQRRKIGQGWPLDQGWWLPRQPGQTRSLRRPCHQPTVRSPSS